MSIEHERTTSVAFIGLGVMGYPMAGHLARAGLKIHVYNRTAHKAEDWVAQHGGGRAESPGRAAEGADVVFACVGGDDDVRAVTLGPDGAFAGMRPGAVFVDHTTTSAGLAQDLAAVAANEGLHFLDAPVSGGQQGAERGTLTVMVGGEARAFTRAEAVIGHYARAVTHMGASGAGQLTKMVNQICVVGVIQGLAEGLNFAERAGLDGDRVLEVISQGAASSWQMVNRGATMIEGRYDFGFAVDLMRKDLGICLAESRGNGARLPIAALVDQLYAQLQQRGHGRWDTSALIELLRKP
jgi:3-hydroxyisobutyrate dehydrogenase